MILFISRYPCSEIEQSGWLQRVAFIDKLFVNDERLYLDISYRKNFIPKILSPKTNLKIYKLNLFLHLFIILYFAIKASFIYIHALGNAEKAIPLYLINKVITDMHGIPPEEMKYCYKNNLASAFYSVVERIVIRKSYKIIAVTKAMEVHYKYKYKNIKAKILIIPIMDDYNITDNIRASIDAKPTIIYSGGIEKWQNIDFMLETIANIKDKFNFVVLTGKKEEFKLLLENYGIDNLINPIKVPKNEVYNYYLKTDFGFVLRENNIVNQVACPTKLIEYLVCGVIPIVLQPEIGDFNSLGYSYLTADDILAGNIPSDNEICNMRDNNYRVINDMRKITETSIKELIKGM